MGTIDYVSLERPKLIWLDIDTGDDIYSLWVLLAREAPLDRQRRHSAASA